MKKTIGYLGPEGSYSHEVAIHIGASRSLLALEPSKFAQALKGKRIFQAVLPVVNAIGWQVQWVLDLLMSNNGDHEITREIVWNIRSQLVGFGKIGDVKVVCSHPQPLNQCQAFLGRMDGVTTQGMNSTSAAVKLIADKKDPAWAAIGTDNAATRYHVPIIARDISDHDENQTRFLVLGGNSMAPTGKDKTSLLFGTSNKPGALLRALEVLDALDINMSSLFSMPSPNRRLGECFFLVDVAGHGRDKDLSVALDKIRTRVGYLKILGSYPESNQPANAN
ncbi:MAG: prephenate dehydratase [Candidatus Staskawiczbacteria bacterium]|nr:prephenate dehydratase [Candidatus Staskawiczbacteria bacterium]